jgi:DNA topoisomerase-1
MPESLRNQLTTDQYRLYDLIWKRTVASQMSDARGKRKQLVVAVDDALFSVGGKTIDFPGYLRAYVEGADDPEAELADRETLLPDVQPGDSLKIAELEPKSHTTMPPSRYSEAALTKVLTDKGIGRPSTYASIIETIQTRNYVFKKGGALVPTWVAFAVSQLMEEHLADLIDYDFTAQMEDQLDAISRGELGQLQYLKEFYFGEAQERGGVSARAGGVNPPTATSMAGLKPLLENKKDEIDARAVNTFPLEAPPEFANDELLVVRVGKFGPFVQQGERTGALPEDLPPDELSYEKALELLNAKKGDESLGEDPNTGTPVYLKNGRFGPYIQLGEPDDKAKKNASLLKNMLPETVTLDVALQLLSLPRNLGKNPETDIDVFAQNGKFGPYISCGKDTRSLPVDLSPLEVDLEQALELLSQPKAVRGRRGATGKVQEPLKTFDVSPVTGNPIKLLSGRYGDYITDGETNATLPKTVKAEDLTQDRALELLADKAAKGTVPKRKKAAKKATKKAAKKTR